MKNITLFNTKEAITYQEISNFEKENNYNLPQSYKDFLVNNNGGVPKENIFWDGELETGISFFYPLKYGKNTVENVIDNIVREDALPKHYFPFASTGGSGVYTFSMINENLGEIYLFHFDGSEPMKIAKSFEDFINNLEE